jgi:hypothetical protein
MVFRQIISTNVKSESDSTSVRVIQIHCNNVESTKVPVVKRTNGRGGPGAWPREFMRELRLKLNYRIITVARSKI